MNVSHLLYYNTFCDLLLHTAYAGYSYTPFPSTICRSVCGPVGLSVCLSSALWKNGGSDSDPDAVRLGRSDGSGNEAGSGVWGSVHVKG